MNEMDNLDHVVRGLQCFPGKHTKVEIELTEVRFNQLKQEVIEEYDKEDNRVEFLPLEKRVDQICVENVVGRYGLVLFGIRFTFIVRG